MPLRTCLQILLFLCALTSACGSDPAEPAAAALELTIRTTGRDLDSDGYDVTIDAGSPLAVPTNGSVTIPDLAPGVHTLVLTGLAGNCTLTTPTPLEITVPGAAGAVTTVEVACTAIYTLAYRGASGVELTNAAGTVHRTLVPGEADPLAWSPDGRLLAVSKNDDGVFRLWIASLDDGDLRRLTSFGERVAVWNTVGVWSPDGREVLLETILLSHTAPTSLTRYTVDESYPPRGVYGIILGMNEGRVIGVRGATWPDWSPDGSQIVIHETAEQETVPGRPGRNR
jgi:WD40 repeat protein